MKLDLSTKNKNGQSVCSIRVTSENGALCIINPLFLHEHGDKWLTQQSQTQVEMKRRSVPWSYDLNTDISRQTEDFVNNCHEIIEEQQENTGRMGQSKESDRNTQGPTEETPEPNKETLEVGSTKDPPEEQGSKEVPNISKMRKQRISRGHMRLGSKRLQEHKQLEEESKNETKTLRQNQDEKRTSLFQHRVSWIESVQPSENNLEKSSSETSLISSDSFLLPPLPELDSVSISSMEEDVDCHALNSKRKHSHGLGDIVRHSILAVSTVLTGLMSPEKYLANRIQQLAEDPTTYFGSTVQTFICNTHKGGLHNQSSTEMLQNIRQLLTNLRNHLLEKNEIWEIMEHQEIEESKTASIIETSLYKCILKPVRNAIHTQLLDIHTKDGSLPKLLMNQEKLLTGDLIEQKPRAGLPGPSTMEKIKEKLLLMHMSYSPKKMTTHLLKVCKLLYESMESSSDKKEAFGADDFLPVLIHVLMGCDLTSVQLDVEYMMELADPSQLQGEGGYYLTTMFGALYHISSFNTISRQLSLEAQNSIRQWQRRRTIHHRHPMQKEIQRANKEVPETRTLTVFRSESAEDFSNV
uniref:VPS9 domain-containing protein n=1 Tax=Leptobrachium leishanense TaxID=445787 RepID=A0A8C5P7G6_9ANUR